jgi:hypothetical protein
MDLIRQRCCQLVREYVSMAASGHHSLKPGGAFSRPLYLLPATS